MKIVFTREEVSGIIEEHVRMMFQPTNVEDDQMKITVNIGDRYSEDFIKVDLSQPEENNE